MRYYAIISIFLLCGCQYGGVGMPVSSAWKATASEEDSECKNQGDKYDTEAYWSCIVKKRNRDSLAISNATESQLSNTANPIRIKCKSYGFKKGTDAFANCVMKLEEAKAQEGHLNQLSTAQMQAQQNAAEEEKARRIAAFFANNAAQERQRIQQQQPIQTNCSQVGYGFNCTTYPARLTTHHARNSSSGWGG
jgi:hypothetical protein